MLNLRGIHSQDLIKRFAEKDSNESTVRKQIERADHLDRSLLLKNCKPKRLMIAFRKSTSLKQLIGTNTIRNNQKFVTPTQTTTAGQCTSCYTSRSLCCQQVLKATTFTSTQTRETCTIFHQVTCHSNYVICLLDCILCKIQYVGKSENHLISD